MSGSIAASRWLAHADAGDLGVAGARLIRMHQVREARGLLTVGEADRELPFAPRRFFVISHVPDENIRGEHAHIAQHQLLVCLAGSVTAEVDDGRARRVIVLDSPGAGLHMAPMVWGAQRHYTRDAVLLVIASHAYDPGDYIRDYAEFTRRLG
jgi:hypothetical protein